MLRYLQDKKLLLATSPIFQLLFDIIAIIISFALLYFIRFESGLFPDEFSPDFSTITVTCFVIVIYWIIVFWLADLYKNWYIRSPIDEYFSIIKASFFGNLFIFFIIFLDTNNSPRLLFLVYFALLSVCVITGRLLNRNFQKKLRINGFIDVPVLIIGDIEKSCEMVEKINNSPAWGFHVAGLYFIKGQKPCNIEHIVNNYPVYYNNEDNLNDIIDEVKPNEVFITVNDLDHALLLKTVSICSNKRIDIKIEPDLYDYFSGTVRAMHLYGIPLIEINPTLMKPWHEAVKRLFDILFSLLVLTIGLPFWIIFSFVIKMETPGPVLYKQERVGKHKKKFMIYKFRSMVSDAEKHGPKWAIKNDPRVTGIGKYLRRSHLDEVPQFWNVLKGDMSIVGPRPERPIYVDKYGTLIPYYNRRHIVRPGLTGLNQVKYTTYHETVEEVEKRLKDDFYYIENISLKLDLDIIIRTIFLVIKGHGQT